VLENRVLLTGTSGVYDENVDAPNTVDFVATGSTVTNTDFATSVAADYQNNHGGVIDATSLAFFGYDYGVNSSKTLLVTRVGTNYGIGTATTSPNAASRTGAFVSTSGANGPGDKFSFTSFDLSIQDGVTDEHVIEIGVTVLSFTGRDYGNVTVIGRLDSGATLSATRSISEATALGDTFYGLTAPEGDYFTGFSIGYDGVINEQLWFDDIGFRTAGSAVNKPPVARNNVYAPFEDTPLVIQSPGILGNNIDPNGDSLTAEMISGPSRGTLEFQDDGSFTYTPAADLHGIDTFTYRALDGRDGVSNVATVTLRVRPVNDAPQLDDVGFSITENSDVGTSVGTVTATDVEQNPLTYAITGGNSSGAFAINSATGEITVADAAPLDFETTPQFSLTVQVTETTGGALSDTATVTIDLTDVQEILTVGIDADPGDDTNTIDLKRDKKVAVAILSTSSLNAPLDVDLNSLTFGRTGDEDSVVRHRKRGTIKFEVEDVNGDGLLDLVVYFETTKTGFEVGDTEATLKGQLLDGTLIEGTSDVEVKTSSKGGKGLGKGGKKERK
jgi:hypothetical protein